MKLGDLSLADIGSRLRSGTLRLSTGPFKLNIASPIPAIAEGLALLYADFPLAAADDFIDFHVQLRYPPSLRRWLRPQALFFFDQRQPFAPLPLDQAVAMLEWGLNWCVANHMHQYLILHAAVLARDDRAVIMPGASGNGKSTLCAALACRGWRLLSDELCLVSMTQPQIIPLPRPVSLKNASIEVIRGFAPQAVLGPVAKDTAKGTVAHMRPPTDSVQHSDTPASPTWIVFPRYQAGSDTLLNEKNKAQAFLGMAEQAFNYSILGLDGFERLTTLVDTCPCYDFVYSDLGAAIVAFEALS